jgi:hypothetical protein
MTTWLLLVLHAGATPGVVTVAPSTCPAALVDTIRAELVCAGFATEGSSAQLATVITRCDEPGRVLVRLEDDVTQKAVERSLALGADARQDARVAVQVVELLRASLAETRFASLMTVPEPVERFLAEQEVAWRGELAAGAMLAPGAFGVQPSVSGALWRSQALRGWQLEFGALVEATVHATRLRATGGSADVGLIWPRVAIAASVELGGVWLAPRVGLGALLVWASGNADATHIATAGVAPTFAASVGVAARRQVTGWLALGLAADVAVAPFPVTVSLPQLTTALGAPFFSFSLHAAFR